MSAVSEDVAFIYGHEVLQILADLGGAATREELRQAATRAFGPSAIFGNCHGARFDFDGLLEFLASVGKLSVHDTDVHLGHVPACGGH